MKSDTLHTYRLSSIKGEGWAIIVIDTSNGFFATVSDWGNYSYIWSSPGGEFRQFLMKLNPDYLYGKIMQGRPDREEYDGEGTKKAISEYLEQELKDDLPSKYEKEKELLERSEFDEKGDFEEWCGKTSLDEPWFFCTTRNNHQGWGFCTKVWPRFVEELKKELETEEKANADRSRALFEAKARVAAEAKAEPVASCQACSIEAEIGTEENPHPVPKRFHVCVPQEKANDNGTTG